MIRYSHRQVGWMMLAAIGATFVLVALQLTIAPAWFLAMPAVALVVVLALFSALRVTITDEGIELSFGIGIIRKTIPVSSVRSVARVRNPWYYGWGIRFIPNGMLYNISGVDAVELGLADGRRVRVGTDEPDAIIAVLSRVPGVTIGSAADEPPHQSRLVPITLLVVFLIIPITIVGTVVYASTRPVKATIANGVLSINGGSSHRTIALGDIKEVSLEPTLPAIALRTNGFSMGGSLRGQFRLETGESAGLFVERNHPPFVVIRTRESRIWVNAAETESTFALYQSLTGVDPRNR